jgi:hypothetical protein
MSVITPDNNDVFKSARIVFAKVRRFLSSYGDANMIDEGEFPTYVNEILRLLGIAVYKESDAVVKIKNYKGKLPCDFAQLYAAYKCTPYVMSTNAVNHPQGQPISVYNDVTWELLEASAGCDIQTLQVTNNDPKIIEHISVRQYVREERQELNFRDPILLRLSPNMRRDLCGDDCTNTFSTSPFEIAISSNQILTNFKDDAVYMKYYAFPKDEDGIPMIMDEERLEKCIEWYIIYQETLRWWMNGSVPNLENRWQYAENKYNEWMAKRRNFQKTPSFAQQVNSIRRNRAVNKIAIFTK